MKKINNKDAQSLMEKTLSYSSLKDDQNFRDVLLEKTTDP